MIPVNCEQMKEEDIRRILTELLYAFPLTRIEFFVPRWIETLDVEHPVKKAILESIREIFANVGSLRDVTAESLAPSCEYIDKSKLEQISLSDGSVQVRLEVPEKWQACRSTGNIN